jgi:predicted O-methyltransferase YrrM
MGLTGFGQGQISRMLLSFVNKVARRWSVYRATGFFSLNRFIETKRASASTSWADELAAKLDLSVFDSMKPLAYHDVTPWEKARFLEVSGLVCQAPAPAVSLLRAVQYVLDAKIPGDLVECGVYRGASPILMAKALQKGGEFGRKIWLYDTFEGMPKPSEEDVYYTGHREIDVWDQRRRGDSEKSTEVYSPLDEVKRNVFRSGYPSENFVFVKGKVEDTIPDRVPAKIALLRLDTDYYASTRHELEHLYPLLSRAGVLILDDYGAYQGARKAVDEYLRNRPIFLARLDENVRIGIKLD